MNLDRPIGDIFVEEGYLTNDQLSQILRERPDATEPLGATLVSLHLISDKQRLKCEGLQLGIPFIDLVRVEIDPAVARKIPHAAAMRLMAVPIEFTEFSASVAMLNPLDLTALDELASLTGVDIDPMLATEDDIREAIFRTFGAYDDLGELVGEAVRGMDSDGLTLAVEEEEQPINVVELRETVEGAPVIKLANALMLRAISLRASDIHIEPQARRVRVRFRIDGLLQEAMSVPKDLQLALASRIKILANLDIAERRAAQDGRCTLVSARGEFDFRVATYPSVQGETIVIRILDKNATLIDLTKLGIPEPAHRALLQKLEEPQGLILVTGPTGSGKTTTLYAAVSHLNGISRKIITIEDPVEYQLDGITQGNVNPKAGVTFPSGLRAMLRQDPDVMLIGEVRDPETAATAVEASLTGHLVLTSLHANDSAGAITRLLDMGIESFLLAGGVTCSVAQRLIRTNCTKCQERYTPDPRALERLSLSVEGEYLRGRGCEHCAKTGFRGRMGVYEVLTVTNEIRKILQAGGSSLVVREQAIKEGMMTLQANAADRVISGETTIEEVFRVASEAA